MAEERWGVSWPGWDVVGIIGHGGFGEVYEIERNVFGHTEKAALKVISIPRDNGEIDELYNDGYDNASITQRLRGYLKDIVREYSFMSEMRGHTNIVYCDDIRCTQHDDGIGWDIYIKMELLTPLPKMSQSSFSEELIIQLGIDICNALMLCRRKDIVHRDIKPQNILVSEDGNFKLGDFGIAKTAERTTSGTKIGTYKYMAPEVYHNQPYGHAADIYSLGMVLYWLLNERRTPFLPLPPQVPSASEEESARRSRFDGIPIPEPLHGSDELKRIVLKACAFFLEDRYKSADEMRNDFIALTSNSRYPSWDQNATVRAESQPRVRVPQSNGDETVGNFGSDRQKEKSNDKTVSAFSKPKGREYHSPTYKRSEQKKAARGWALLCVGVAVLAVIAVFLWLMVLKTTLATHCKAIFVSDNQLSFTSLEEKRYLRTQLVPTDTTDTLQFISQDTTIVLVDENGAVTPVREGETEIIISCGEQSVIIPVSIQIPAAPPETETTQPPQTLPTRVETVPTTEPIPETTQASFQTQPHTTFPATQPTLAIQTATGYITNAVGGLNVRQRPSTSAQRVRRLYNGDQVTILERVTAEGMEWGRISDGWICMNYVTFNHGGSAQSSSSGQSQGVTYVVSEDVVNIRSGAGTSYPSLRRVTSGEKLVVYEQTFSEGRTWGRTDLGWVCMDYLVRYTPDTVTEAATTAPKKENMAVVKQKQELRAAPSTGGRVITTLNAGIEVQVLRLEAIGSVEWAYVNVDTLSVMGWISTSALDMSNVHLTSASTDDSFPSATTGTIMASSINVRSGPGRNYIVIGSVSYGERVTILETVSSDDTVWGQIGQGWIDMNYVDLD